MSNELFNKFSAIGIGLTFLASIAAVIVSIISLRYSNKVAKRSGYLGTITASRDKWSNSLRESSSLYFTQIARICSGQEDNLEEIYNELTRYHFAIVLLLFEQDEEIHNNMSVVRSKAFEIVDQSNIINQQYKKLKESPNATETYIESQEVVVKARQKMYDLRCSILNDYQGRIFNGIRNLLEREWRKQQYEATDMWKEK
ncbi:hypothetical protein DWW70_14135 [Coprococcus sp. AF16-5]|uniref:hypothetical protein n=1 Tax=Coprococcus sp. AF16-5 TaxID=2293088 RepID=UPI000E4DC980|nr:hypothetical protein [Coprococcus sp. AF16-5]RHR64589.1 hypothetical protein DWW70_14135 [Coprococcus sp. AF16-5]